MNLTNVDAVDGAIMLYVCEKCSFVTEPTGFSRVTGSPDDQRNYPIRQISAKTKTELMEFDMGVPGPGRYGVGINYRCRTCVIPNAPHAEKLEDESGVVTAVSSPQG